MKKSTFLLATLFLTSILFVSCTKEDAMSTTDNSPIVASTSIDLVNELDIQTGNEVSYKNLTAKTGKTLATSCGTITMDPQSSTFPKTFYVDFGTTGCVTNGISRKGKLKITFSGYITETGSTMTVERVDYSVNGNKIEGKIVYKNTTTSPNTPQWSRTVTNGKFTDTKGDVYLNSGIHTVKQTAGVSTLTLNDNTYEMTEGTHTVTKQNGTTITLSVVEALVKNFSCEYVSKGKLKVESALLNGIIDYGNGDCDNKGTYTQNGIVFPFTM
ncbi:hypothetical protein MCETHM1_03729 [Flavobacteriaceae bacterium]|jgi:3',5'-cyclic AMP phosphodiesterase CpdA